MAKFSFLPPVISALSALAVAGCAVGPDFLRPSLLLPAEFAHGGDVARMPGSSSRSASAGDPQFWRTFDDPQLSELVKAALVANHDLRIALAHYDRAAAQQQGTRLDQFPIVTASAAAADDRISTDQALGAAQGNRQTKSYAVGFSAAWELDLFGRVRRSVEAGQAETDASAADLRAAQVAIVGQVARTYVNLRGQQERLHVAKASADLQRQTLSLVESRWRAGGATEFDAARSRGQLESTLAGIPGLEASIANDMHRLAVLIGRTPKSLSAQLTPQRALPSAPGAIDPGTPGDLVRRRPDVAAAEARLHAATARIGVATADLFPRFVLSGLLGTQAIDSSALFGRGSDTRLIALGVDWTFLDAGHVKARISAADADGAAALARYEQVVLLALQDTEDALARYGHALAAQEHLERAAKDGSRAAQIAHAQFEAGAVDLLAVLDAERTALQAQDAFAVGRTLAVTSAVSLYQSVAGGWPQTRPKIEPVASR